MTLWKTATCVVITRLPVEVSSVNTYFFKCDYLFSNQVTPRYLSCTSFCTKQCSENGRKAVNATVNAPATKYLNIHVVIQENSVSDTRI